MRSKRQNLLVKLVVKGFLWFGLFAFLPLNLLADNTERIPCPSSHIKRQRPVTARRASARQAAAYVGEKRQLVILVSFSDMIFLSEEPLQWWDRIFNEEGFHEGRFHGSVHDYFYDQSYGQFNLHFDLKYIAIDQSYTVYGGGNDSKVGLLVMKLVDAVKDEVDDWAPYDWDGDGSVDQLFILYAGKGQNNGGGSKTIWPHQWSLSEQGREPITVMTGNRAYTIDNYGCFAELSKNSDYGTFGTLCHEYSHCLGLPDFYYGNNVVVHSWDVMDYGLYNNDGFCPAGYTAHERMYLGWLDLKELTAPASIRGMGAVSDTQEAYLVRNEGYSQEYYVIENRQKTGWDQYLPSSGILVFHVNYNDSVWRYGEPNTMRSKNYTIIPANNGTSYLNSASWAYPYADNDSLTNLSLPAASLWHANTDGSYLMNKPITNMQVVGGLASFDFMGGTSMGIQSVRSHKKEQRVYNLKGQFVGTDVSSLPAGLYVVRSADGKSRTVAVL